MGKTGISLGRDPVARMMCDAAYDSLEPSPPSTSALEMGDFVLLEQVRHAPAQLPGDGPASLLGRAQHRLNPIEGDAMQLGGLHLVDKGGTREQGFGWNTADVQANTTELVFLDTRHAQSQLTGSYGRYIAAGTGTDDKNVEALL